MKKLLLATLFISATGAHAQSAVTRHAGEQLLDLMFKDIKHFYYDPTFQGVDLDAALSHAKADMKTFRTDAEFVTILANALKPLHDSHTFFIPPLYQEAIDFGFQMRFYGEQALVTQVKAGSNAEEAGLKPGDIVETIDGRRLTRETLAEIAYDYFLVAPRSRIQLLTTTLEGRPRQVVVRPRVEKGAFDAEAGWGVEIRMRVVEDSVAKENAHVYGKVGKLFVWRMTGFNLWGRQFNKIMKAARGSDAMVLDMRGNYGGSIDALKKLVSYFYDKPIEIGTMVSRSKVEALKVKPDDNIYAGKLFILVDSETASAAEMFARLAQITGRGVVIGDRTAGAVRIGRRFYYTASDISTSASITVANLLMPDGKALEGVGVIPDEFVVLKSYNIAEHADPMMSYALTLAGHEIDAVAAASILTR